MTAKEIRNAFLEFFRNKQHQIVKSAPMVIKNDPTLMFTNAGMNQFKDLFLGNSPIKYSRIADSQKCLRVSGKHNDLEEVGHDTYHHTMFEMLGNWSFGDYFKKEAIEWAWEFLVDNLKIEPERLYATVFEGSSDDNVEFDTEAHNLWKKFLPETRILKGSKKDNFWEMGESGPCGPCSEIHVDIRSTEERNKIGGETLVNRDHPHVIEIWNLVFIQYNRKSNGQLEALPQKHVDTGMGFERLCMVVQKKQSNYDTDVFQPIIQKIATLSSLKYGEKEEADIAIRVVADHLRTISFAITDGQLPSNNKAGYVIRRILRRAVRYAYTFLNQKDAFMYRLLPVLIDSMGEAYPELHAQKELIEKVILEEENAFLRTLDNGIRLLDQIIENTKTQQINIVDGKSAFHLFDSFGFPLDLTELILAEHNFSVNKQEFDANMKIQKERSRAAGTLETDDWVEVHQDDVEEFIGYDKTEAEIKIVRYRKVKVKNKDLFQLVFNFTPFYAESGGQVGDTGYIESEAQKIYIVDTQKENNLIIHLTNELPKNTSAIFKAVVDSEKRLATACNHSATHLLHSALREVLGTHVEQKGSLVSAEYLRFDFAHFQKLSDEELQKVETIVNKKIRCNIPLNEKRNIPINQAQEMGAIALFGEKYGDFVRVIKFDNSIELCGGTHIDSTGKIGYFKIIKESAIAAGVRRIEAITAIEAEKYINENFSIVKQLAEIFKTSKNYISNIEKLQQENATLQKQIESFMKENLKSLKKELISKIQNNNGIQFLAAKVDLDADAIKDLSYQLKGEIENLFLVIGNESEGKAGLSVMISENLVHEKGFDAGKIIREIAKEIQGGGGGQKFYATAGGKNPKGIEAALKKAEAFLAN